MTDEELTPAQVADWFNSVTVGQTYYSITPTGTRGITRDMVAAYVRKLEQRVVRLAAKLADL